MRPRTTGNETAQHLTRAIRDQIDVLRCHIQDPQSIDAGFVRDHALMVLQLSEALQSAQVRP